ncbi:MAG: hypothetical protein KBG48_35460 [Kofleriaceae bacterium]|nr:hypothetical protein [Kofleriaceae bacterium]MBP9172712.1 hypothetical protein [Kofleriaceae bacterium]MBP9862639.1 hypothetical protein [Kofleriaceae bacterium]
MFRSRTCLPIVLAALVAPAAALAQPRRPAPTPTPAPPPPSLTEDQARTIAEAAADAAVARERARAEAEATERDAKAAAELAAARAEVTALREKIDALAVEQGAIKAAADASAAEAKAADGDDYVKGGGGFTDVRLNLTFTNENMLTKPGETIPSVPGWRFGRPNSLGTLFFDNYDTRFSGYETLGHAIIYRNYRKGHVEAEGGLVIRMNELAERRIDLSDAGSYVLVSWWKDPERKDPTRFTLTAFPVSSDRMRLGYSYRLSWGGNEEYRRSSQAVPGVKLQVDTEKAYAFVGAKSSVLLDRATAEQVAKLAFLFGAGYDVSPMLRVEVNGGYFNRGSNELEDVNTEDVQLYGVSAQVAAHDGMPVSSSIDYKLYKYDPERIGRAFSKTKYPGGVTWLAMAEATYLGQTLKDPEKSGSTKVQSGFAADLNLRAMVDRVRARVDLQYRDLAFILHSVPSLPTFSDFPAGYERSPNFFAAVGADRNFDDALTVGAVIGVELPATLTTPTGLPGAQTTGESTAVIRNNGADTIITVLPPGEEAAPAYAFKFTGQYDFAEFFSAIVDVYFTYDPNQTRLRRDDAEALFEYEFGDFNQLGTNVTLQARF